MSKEALREMCKCVLRKYEGQEYAKEVGCPHLDPLIMYAIKHSGFKAYDVMPKEKLK